MEKRVGREEYGMKGNEEGEGVSEERIEEGKRDEGERRVEREKKRVREREV